MEIDPGNYTYTIQYETDRQLDFSQGDTDRLYWNVTGQNWTFPIDQVRTKVFLPIVMSKTTFDQALTNMHHWLKLKSNFWVSYAVILIC